MALAEMTKRSRALLASWISDWSGAKSAAAATVNS
jgi:hypothetical protein